MSPICPKCGKENEMGAAFCQFCGAAMHPETRDESLAPASDEGEERVEDIAAEVPDEAAAPAEPQEEEDLLCGDLLLEFNDNHPYLQGCKGVLEFRVTNLSAYSLTPKISLESGQAQKPRRRRLAPGDKKTVRLQIDLDEHTAGEELLNIMVVYKRNTQPVAYCAETIINVLERDLSPSQFVLNMQRMIDASQGGKVMGVNQEILKDIKDLIKSDKITSVNDLLRKRMSDNFRTLDLEFDHEHTDELRKRVTTTVGVDPVDGRFDLDVEPLEKSSLYIESDDVNVVLVSKPKVTFGRNRTNDIVLRRLPRHEEDNDERSMQVSGEEHCALIFHPVGAALIDEGSTNGTYFLDRDIRSEPQCALDLPPNVKYPIAIADALELQLVTYPFSSPMPDNLSVYLRRLHTECGGLWDVASTLDISAVKIERVDNVPDEKYIVVLNSIKIGTSNRNALCLRGEGIDEIQCRILNINGSYYLERLAEGGILNVEGIKANVCSLIPLKTGMTIEIGDKTLNLREYEQKHL